MMKREPFDNTNTRKELVMTVGLPYSGKSTYAQHANKYPIVCPDAIRLAIHGQRYSQVAEDLVWATAKIMVRSLFQAGHDRVTLDACSQTKKRRDVWKEFKRLYVVMDIHPAICIQRARENKDWEIVPVIQRMAVELDYDGILYGFNGHDPMGDHIKRPCGSQAQPQLHHEGREAEGD